MRKYNLSAVLFFFLCLCVFSITGCGGGGGGGGGAVISPVVSKPMAPTPVTAIGGIGENTISWPMVVNATSYNLYFANSPGVTIETGTKIAGLISPYTHTGVIVGVPYYYVVTAVNAAGESIIPPEVTATAAYADPVVNGTAYSTLVDGTGNKFIPTLRQVAGNSNDIFLSKFNAQNILLNEWPVQITTSYDELRGAVYNNGFVYFMTNQDVEQYPGGNGGNIRIIKMSTSGEIVYTNTLANFGAISNGLVVDPTTELLYTNICESAVSAVVTIDPMAGAIIHREYEQAINGGIEQFYGAIVVGSDGIYVVGTLITTSGGYNRIYVVKFDKVSYARIWAEKYGEFDGRNECDSVASAELASDGNLIVKGRSSLQNVTLQFNKDTGAITTIAP